MTKAEKRALECFPTSDNWYTESERRKRRKGYVEGYHQAEKDLIENKHEKVGD